MDLQHIRAFVAVAREGNLTRAAERLHLTQAAVSVQMKNFQQSLDLTLLVRTATGLSLTPDGREILPYAERILLTVGELQHRASAMQDAVRGDLHLGTTLNPEVTRLGDFLQTLVHRHPGIRTRLTHGMSGVVRDDVARGVLDAGYFVEDADAVTDSPELHSVTLTAFTHYVIAPRGWRERVQGKGWEDLVALPWVWAHPSSVNNRLVRNRLAPLGLKVRIVAEADVEASMLDMVRSGIGLALARESVAVREAETHGLVVLHHLPLPARLSFICLAARRHEPLIEAAFSAVASAFEP